MPRKPKREEIQAWPRPYLNQDQRAAELYNLRGFFIKCIERRTPRVVEDLAQEVLPHYKSAFFKETVEYGLLHELYLDKRAYHHRAMAEVFIDPAAPSQRWSSYEAVRERLSAWADRYNLKVDWLLILALDALLEWSYRGTTFPKFHQLPESEAQTYAQSLCPDDREAFFDEREQLQHERINWPIVPILPEHLRPEPLPTRVFEYPPWDNQDDRLYERAIRQMFDQHLRKYLDEIRLQISTLVSAKPVSKPERFDMLALYLCRDLSGDQIADLHNPLSGQTEFSKDPSGILKDIREAAQLLKLPLPKKPGRRRKQS